MFSSVQDKPAHTMLVIVYKISFFISFSFMYVHILQIRNDDSSEGRFISAAFPSGKQG